MNPHRFEVQVIKWVRVLKFWWAECLEISLEAGHTWNASIGSRCWVRTYPSSSIDVYILHMKPRQCAIMGYAPVGMCFNSISMCHTLDMFHVCYEVMSVNTAEPKSAMCDSDWWNMEKSVDCGSVVEWSVLEVTEGSRIGKIGEKQRKNSDIIAVPPTNGPCPHGLMACPPSSGWLPLSSRRVSSLWSIRVSAIEILF